MNLPTAPVLEITPQTFEKEVVQRSLETPVLVDFWATWCGPCKTLGPVLEKLAGEYAGAFVLAKIDIDRNAELADMFGVQSVPTVVLVSGGQVVDGFVGAQPESKIRELLARHGVGAKKAADPVAEATPVGAWWRNVELPVERDGMVVIPQVGAIPVGGQTFSQAERTIHARLSMLLKRFELHVSMARIRTMKVYVVGEVARPGAYELSALATASNAIYAACGPSRSGSLRQVRIMREGKTVGQLDLYEFLLQGDRRQDNRLQAGDVVLVPPLGPVVAVSGSVKRPAIYELKPGTRLTELLTLAGGLTPLSDRQRCHLFRQDPALQERNMIDVDLVRALASQGQEKNRLGVEGGDPILLDGDYIRIATLPTQVVNVVSLVGAVKSPGPYEFRAGMHVKDILTPEQLTVDAYADRAEIVRTDPVTYLTKVRNDKA